MNITTFKQMKMQKIKYRRKPTFDSGCVHEEMAVEILWVKRGLLTTINNSDALQS